MKPGHVQIILQINTNSSGRNTYDTTLHFATKSLFLNILMMLIYQLLYELMRYLLKVS